MSFATKASDRKDPICEISQTPEDMETILLVEDEQMVRTLARHILELIGYNVLEAASGGEAMAVCKDHQDTVDLLLTDVVMPKMSGPELRQEVIKRWPDIGVLYMSGYSDEVVQRHELQSGVPLLLKPFSPQALALKVREILDGRRTPREFLDLEKDK